LAGIGDVAVASALITRIRAEQPLAHVTFLTGKVAAPVARLFDVDEVLEIDESLLLRGGTLSRGRVLLSLWPRLMRGGFDRVLVLHVDRRYRALTATIPWVRTHMLSRREHGEMIPVPGRWLGDEYARLLEGSAHVGPVEHRYGMADLRDRIPPTKIGERVVVLIPGGARNVLREQGLKRWPVGHYAELARLLIGDDFTVAILGNDADAWVLPAFDGIPVRNEIGRHDLVGTLSLMRGSDLVVSHDTGPMHLARLVRTPLVALFGPTNPHELLWQDESVRVLWGGERLACRPCYDGRDFAHCADNICISSVSPAVVHEAVRAAFVRVSERASVPSV
jgi:heptosyltransferase-2